MRPSELPIGPEVVDIPIRDPQHEMDVFTAFVRGYSVASGRNLVAVYDADALKVELHDEPDGGLDRQSTPINRGVCDTVKQLQAATVARLDGMDHWPEAPDVGPCPFTFGGDPLHGEERENGD